uniref:Uncharacterized protein n=1 Tax=Parascaris equorum TaxID=6256 RepID=A0A914RCM4_PAREQ
MKRNLLVIMIQRKRMRSFIYRKVSSVTIVHYDLLGRQPNMEKTMCSIRVRMSISSMVSNG